MTKPLLSICIATYNRADYIGATLESIIPQITNEVEVVIVDGASTDQTSSVVTRYTKTCGRIRYVQLPAKGGVDQDFCKAVELAQGKYCWLFTDDDLLKPNAVSAVLKELQYGYSLIVVNAQAMNKDLSKVISNRVLLVNSNEVYNVSELPRLFQCTVEYMSFIGCVVVKRDLWLERDKECYFGSEFIHVGVVFQTPLPAPAIVIAEPYITIRLDNAQWSQRAFEIWMYKWPNLLCSFTDIPEQARKDYKKTPSWLRLKNIIIHRANGEYSLREYLKWLSPEDSSLWWKMITLCVAIAPSIILRLAIVQYFRMANKEALGWWHR